MTVHELSPKGTEVCPRCGSLIMFHSLGPNGSCPSGPVECLCRYPKPDGIGECTQCKRRVLP